MFQTGGAAEPYLPAPWRIADKISETADTVTLTIEPNNPASPFEFEPGQFNMLYAFGCGEVPISISGAIDGRLIHTIRSVGSVTAPLTALEPGDALGLRGPFGAPWPIDAARGKDVIVVAGGLGLAPLRPVITSIIDDRASFSRVNVLYGSRDPSNLLYRDEIASWRGRFDLDVDVTVDRAGPDWRGDVGVILKLIKRLALDPASTTAFVCGPEIMMRLAASELLDQGLGSDAVYVSLERNMKCAIGRCGHCQFGPHFVCKDGPVFRYDIAAPLLAVPEV